MRGKRAKRERKLGLRHQHSIVSGPEYIPTGVHTAPERRSKRFRKAAEVPEESGEEIAKRLFAPIRAKADARAAEIETLSILSDPEAMEAINEAQAEFKS